MILARNKFHGNSIILTTETMDWREFLQVDFTLILLL